MKIYVPDLENYECFVIRDENIIRAYQKTPMHNSTIDYRDYYYNSNSSGSIIKSTLYEDKTTGQKFAKQGTYFDCIFVDPPRKGCDGTTIDALIKLNPKRIVYISCNPSTLARDCALLKGHYTVEVVQPVDMFSQTHHVETVCLMSRVEGK